ncbi:hypothetical protein ACOSP7_021137 [Xanthoceras sorbifolium]
MSMELGLAYVIMNCRCCIWFPLCLINTAVFVLAHDMFISAERIFLHFVDKYPVIDDKAMIGMVSIGDVVRAVVSEHREELDRLNAKAMIGMVSYKEINRQ